MLCVAGEGWYQEEGSDAIGLKPGMAITVPAGVKHWHGAKSDSWFSHIALGCPGVDTNNEWCETVDEREYGSL